MLGDDDLEAPRSARRMTFLAGAAWSIALGLAWNVLMEITESARPGASADLVNITACKVLASSVFLFLMLRVYAPQSSIRDVLGVRDVSVLAVTLAAAVGALLYPGLSMIDDAVTKRFPVPAEESDLVEKLMSVTSLRERLVLFASIVLVIPLCEELFFRGVLFRGLRRGRPEGLAVLGVAALYGFSHGDIRSLPTSLVIGLVTAWLRGRSGSLVPSVFAHVAFYAVPLVPMAFGRGEIVFGGRVVVGAVVTAGICAWVLSLIFARDGRAEDARLLDA
ncbi:MAG: type II CAAX prenyl endopeptidase Rce1 family protein [Polyangiaceae bacterium]